MRHFAVKSGREQREKRSLSHWPTVLLSYWHHKPTGSLVWGLQLHSSSFRPLSTLFQLFPYCYFPEQCET